jgi:hypothetical protein
VLVQTTTFLVLVNHLPLFCPGISRASNPVAKMATRSYTPLRRSLTQLSARSTRIAGRSTRPSFCAYSTEQKPPQTKPFTVWRPYLRLAFGVPFIGAIIYSMVGHGAFSGAKEVVLIYLR